MVHTLDHIAAQARAAQAEAQAAIDATAQATTDPTEAWLQAVLAAMGGGATTEQDPVPMGGPEPPDFSRLEAEQMLQDFMAEHMGGGGGGYDPFGYFTSGARYWAGQGAEAAEYISNIPGEAGEAGGEFLSGLGAGAGAGLGGLVDPLTAIPGDLFKNIPIWVPVLGAAFLLTRGK